ncbi:MAG: Crp/Fnr family transcriptional regulator [Hyphomicrobium sp.]|jgi:CRP/FNR family transcriptional regulator
MTKSEHSGEFPSLSDGLFSGDASSSKDLIENDAQETRDGPRRTASARTSRYGRRKVLFEEGEPARYIYQVISGSVVLSRSTFGGRRQILEILGSSSMFGVVHGGEYDCRAETASQAVIQSMDRVAAERSSRIQSIVATQLMRKLQGFHDHAAVLGRKSAAERIAHLLLNLPKADASTASGALRRSCDDRISITQADMASYLGLALETVCRELGELKRSGIIDIKRRGQLTILDVATLAARARPEDKNLFVA